MKPTTTTICLTTAAACLSIGIGTGSAQVLSEAAARQAAPGIESIYSMYLADGTGWSCETVLPTGRSNFSARPWPIDEATGRYPVLFSIVNEDWFMQNPDGEYTHPYIIVDEEGTLVDPLESNSIEDETDEIFIIGLAMDWIERITKVDFIPFLEADMIGNGGGGPPPPGGETDPPFLRIQHANGIFEGNFAHAGMGVPAQLVNIESFAVGVVVHELMHSLGFTHEHMRYDRDTFITILDQNIQEDKIGQLLPKAGSDAMFGAYDFESIMHYSRFAFTRNGLPVMAFNPGFEQWADVVGQRGAISAGDRDKLQDQYGVSACPFDINGDGVLDMEDFNLFLVLWAAGDPAADLNFDGVVDVFDYIDYLNGFTGASRNCFPPPGPIRGVKFIRGR